MAISCNQEKPVETNHEIVPESFENRTKSIDSNLKIEEVIPLKNTLVNNQPDTSSIFKIKGNGVFVIQLTTKESEKLEKQDSAKYEATSEYANNVSTALYDLLNALKIKQYWSDKRYVEYFSNNRNHLIDTRKYDKIRMDCCILFKNNQEPKIVECNTLNEELLTNYFKK
jgi:hypothetical protein